MQGTYNSKRNHAAAACLPIYVRCPAPLHGTHVDSNSSLPLAAAAIASVYMHMHASYS